MNGVFQILYVIISCQIVVLVLVLNYKGQRLDKKISCTQWRTWFSLILHVQRRMYWVKKWTQKAFCIYMYAFILYFLVLQNIQKYISCPIQPATPSWQVLLYCVIVKQKTVGIFNGAVCLMRCRREKEWSEELKNSLPCWTANSWLPRNAH